MTTLKTYASIALTVVATIILLPVLAAFGLVMLGLVFGLSLIAAATAAGMARHAQMQAEEAAATPA